MNKLFTTLASLLLILNAGAQMPGNWQWKNIPSTTSNFYHLKYTGNSTWYAIGAAGTVVKSTNDGTTWTLLNLPQITTPFTQLEHASFVSSSEGWVSNGGVTYHTTDGGATWSDVSTAFNEGAQITFYNTTIGWKGQSELSKTTDGGTTWNVVTLPDYSSDDRIWKIKMFSTTNGVILSNPGKLYKTSDGNTWSRITFPVWMWGNEIMDANSSNNIMVCRSSNTDTIWRTTNAGSSWLYSLIPYYDKGDRTCISYVTDQIILVGLYNYNTSSSRSKIARSSDGGATWNYINLPDQVGIVKNIVMKDASNGLLSGSNGSFYRTSDGGLTWSSLNSAGNYTVEDIEFRNDKYGLMTGHYGIWLTRDGGKNFTKSIVNNTAPGTGTDEFNAITWLSDSKALAMGYGGYAYYSNDSGATWDQGNYTWFIGTFYDAFYQPSSGKIFAAGRAADGAKNITVSTNGGNSWNAMQIPGSFDIKRIWFYDGNLGFALGTDSLNQIKAAAWKTSDGGNTWTKLTLPGLGSGFSSAMDIQMLDANNGWMVGTKIWKTADGGSTWSEVPPGIFLGRMNGVYFESTSKGYITGNQGYFIYTTDGGSTWTQGNMHTYGTLGHFSKIGNTVVFTAEGGGLISNDGSGSGTGIQQLAAEKIPFVYPNPSTDGTIHMLLEQGNNEVFIYDLNGREIYKNAVNGNEITIDNLNRGVYFILLKNADGIKHTKVRID